MTHKLCSILCLVAGVVCNKFVIEALLAGDGKISALSVNIGIIILQVALICAGILYLTRRYDLLAMVGVSMLILFTLQFWVRIGIEIPSPEKRMFAALPFPPSFFKDRGQYQDQISRYEARFTGLRAFLPPLGTVGYLTSEHFSSEEAKFHWGLTGYALMPVRVEWSTEHELIVGNFPDFESVPLPESLKRFVLVKDFGNGVMLFKKEILLELL
jgi:hypothetical protein